MLPQEAMIERLRDLCRKDERLVAAMLYGSFPLGEADQFSDIDVVLFFKDESLSEIEPRAWVEQIAPVELYFVNAFGNGTAIFGNLVRAEFHFDPASRMNVVESWKGNAWFPSLEATVLVDRTGELANRLRPLLGSPPERDSPETARFLANSFINWVLFGSNVVARGELARGLGILHLAGDQLLWMVRLVEGATAHWPTPTRALEWEISPAAYARYAESTAGLDERSIRRAYLSAWAWGKELMRALAERHGLALPEALIEKLDRRLSDAAVAG